MSNKFNLVCLKLLDGQRPRDDTLIEKLYILIQKEYLKNQSRTRKLFDESEFLKLLEKSVLLKQDHDVKATILRLAGFYASISIDENSVARQKIVKYFKEYSYDDDFFESSSVHCGYLDGVGFLVNIVELDIVSKEVLERILSCLTDERWFVKKSVLRLISKIIYRSELYKKKFETKIGCSNLNFNLEANEYYKIRPNDNMDNYLDNRLNNYFNSFINFIRFISKIICSVLTSTNYIDSPSQDGDSIGRIGNFVKNTSTNHIVSPSLNGDSIGRIGNFVKSISTNHIDSPSLDGDSIGRIGNFVKSTSTNHIDSPSLNGDSIGRIGNFVKSTSTNHINSPSLDGDSIGRIGNFVMSTSTNHIDSPSLDGDSIGRIGNFVKNTSTNHIDSPSLDGDSIGRIGNFVNVKSTSTNHIDSPSLGGDLIGQTGNFFVKTTISLDVVLSILEYLNDEHDGRIGNNGVVQNSINHIDCKKAYIPAIFKTEKICCETLIKALKRIYQVNDEKNIILIRFLNLFKVMSAMLDYEYQEELRFELFHTIDQSLANNGDTLKLLTTINWMLSNNLYSKGKRISLENIILTFLEKIFPECSTKYLTEESVSNRKRKFVNENGKDYLELSLNNDEMETQNEVVEGNVMKESILCSRSFDTICNADLSSIIIICFKSLPLMEANRSLFTLCIKCITSYLNDKLTYFSKKCLFSCLDAMVLLLNEQVVNKDAENNIQILICVIENKSDDQRLISKILHLITILIKNVSSTSLLTNNNNNSLNLSRPSPLSSSSSSSRDSSVINNHIYKSSEEEAIIDDRRKNINLIECLGGLIESSNWDIRDSVSEFINRLSIEARNKKDLAMWLFKNNLDSLIWNLVDDEETYVRSTCLQTMFNILQLVYVYLAEFNTLITQEEILRKVFNIIDHDEEAFSRRSAIKFACSYFWYEKSSDVKTKILTTLCSSMNFDQDWEAKLYIVQFFSKIISLTLKPFKTINEITEINAEISNSNEIDQEFLENINLSETKITNKSSKKVLDYNVDESIISNFPVFSLKLKELEMCLKALLAASFEDMDTPVLLSASENIIQFIKKAQDIIFITNDTDNKKFNFDNKTITGSPSCNIDPSISEMENPDTQIALISMLLDHSGSIENMENVARNDGKFVEDLELAKMNLLLEDIIDCMVVRRGPNEIGDCFSSDEDGYRDDFNVVDCYN